MSAGTVLPLEGRTAIVTGSTRGIGLGIARALAEAGCRVVLNGGQPSYCLAGPSLAYIAADLRDPGSVRRLAAEAMERAGAIDILVNNAGIQRVAAVDEFPDEDRDDVIGLNLSAAFRMTRAVLPGMRARHWGRIINIASVHALVASVRKCAYVRPSTGSLA